jgi:hypothetical protein
MVATPTVLPRPPIFPTLMPRPQQPYPTPLAIPGRRVGKLIMRRDLVQEMDDLSDEEAELEDNVRQHRVLLSVCSFTDGRCEADARDKEPRVWLPGADREDVDAA